MPTFVECLIEHTQQYESPGSFWLWSAYTTIGAALRDRCFKRLGDSFLFPNFYTLLVADSAVHRKGEPVKLCERLLTKSKSTKVISGRASIQGILDELGRAETDKQTGELITGGSALFSAPELSAGIVNDPESVKILTDIYEFKEEYTSRLRGSGVFKIKSVCLSMMAASNETLLIDVYDDKAKHGGLLGRTFLVKPNEFRPANSLFAVRARQESFDNLVLMLQEIAKLKGEFIVTQEAQDLYDNWYKPFRKSYEKTPDKSGISGRIHTSVLKLAMVLCVNATLALIIRPEHIKDAIEQAMALLPNYQGLIMATGKSTINEVAVVLIEDIWNMNGQLLSKREFLSRHFHQFDHEIVDKCTATLEQAGLICSITSSTDLCWKLTDKAVEKFNLKGQ